MLNIDNTRIACAAFHQIFVPQGEEQGRNEVVCVPPVVQGSGTRRCRCAHEQGPLRHYVRHGVLLGQGSTMLWLMVTTILMAMMVSAQSALHTLIRQRRLFILSLYDIVFAAVELVGEGSCVKLGLRGICRGAQAGHHDGRRVRRVRGRRSSC